MENAVLIPVFTLIIVTLMILTFYMHDCVVADSASFQSGMRVEQQIGRIRNTNGTYDDQRIIEELQRASTSYLRDKCITAKDIKTVFGRENNKYYLWCTGNVRIFGLLSRVVNIDQKLEIQQNDPPDFIRKVNALKKWGNVS